MNSNLHYIVVAGGSGKRMQTSVPKQYLLLGKIPLIAVTINRLFEAFPEAKCTVVIAEKDQNHWNNASRFIKPEIVVNVAFGGPERFHSVKSALGFVGPNEIVAIHDAVRPLVSTDVLKNGFRVASNSGTAIPVVELCESLREIDGALSKHVDRSHYRLCQTPQFFKSELLLNAYRQSYLHNFTDDATVVEAAGHVIRLIEGNRENIKITTPADLAFAEALLTNTK
ncbi:MAG: 2-C-methyl-D-erythritol 4-phosphate cytidylyltransferase [Bacteroidetes bacterium HGW-Bacteroidetes-6]|jgi:2-C-methyl-D-erythritol 4-phosphate cytidylyltransferase|nr:MAG: 2-C-methyl-D-erythritol 4-phosphate cytidylyltransferase [Bacteroidetes bacterium HGW-Bacteroidetes-6]